MTTAFQTVFDRAESIGINRQPVVAQTISRNNTIRNISRGGAIWRFEVRLPDGIPWRELRLAIEEIEQLGKTTAGTINLNNAGYTDWLMPYRGNSTNLSGWTADWLPGTTALQDVQAQGVTSGYSIRKGDLIQLGVGGHVYTSQTDLAWNSTGPVTLNRAIVDDAAADGTILIGPANVTWSVYCVQLPTWTIFARDQVSWSGPFVFYEAMV